MGGDLDGQLVDTNTNFKTGHTIVSGGHLYIGQEQDSVGGSLDATQAFTGSMTLLRIWSVVRTGEQIAAGMTSTAAVGLE